MTTRKPRGYSSHGISESPPTPRESRATATPTPEMPIASPAPRAEKASWRAVRSSSSAASDSTLV